MESANGICEPRLSASCRQQFANSGSNSVLHKSERIAYLVKQLEGVEQICEAIMRQALVHGAEHDVDANESAGGFAEKTERERPLNSQSASEKEKMKETEPASAIDIIDLTSEDSSGEEDLVEAEQAGATEPDSEAIAPPQSGGANSPGRPREEVLVLSDDDEDETMAPSAPAPQTRIDDSSKLSSRPDNDAPQTRIDDSSTVSSRPDNDAPQTRIDDSSKVSSRPDKDAPQTRIDGSFKVSSRPDNDAPQTRFDDSFKVSSRPDNDPISHVWSYMQDEMNLSRSSDRIEFHPQNTSGAFSQFKWVNGTDLNEDDPDHVPSRWADRQSVQGPIPLVSPTEQRPKKARGRPRKDPSPNLGTVGKSEHDGNRNGLVGAPTETFLSFGGKRKGHLQERDNAAAGNADTQKVNAGRKGRKISRKEGGKRIAKIKDSTDDEDEEDEDGLEKHSKAEEQEPLQDCLLRLRQDDQISYVAHRRNTTENGAGEDYDSDGDLGSVFRELDLADSRFQELGLGEEKEGSCDHRNWDFDESMGYYCEDCGCVNLDMGSKKEPVCKHPNIYFDDEKGFYCLNCGKTRPIEQMLLISDDPKRARKHSNKGQRYDSVLGDDGHEQHFRWQSRPGSKDLDSTEETLLLHPSLEYKLHDHQKAGFKFLAENLIGNGKSDSLGCVIAHAPGTGKTCLVISFIQSYLATFEKGRPLILAPKIMLHSWKKEFESWKYQNVTIHELTTESVLGRDRGTALGDARSDDEDEDEEFRLSTQAKVSRKYARAITLQKWQAERSVLLMSYQLYMLLVVKGENKADPSPLDTQISEILLKVPNLVIMDEGHLARNKKTNISGALLKMETKRRVLLSGTLFQNNFKELFTLLKLCRNDFMIEHPEYEKKISEQGGGIANLRKRADREQVQMQIELKVFSEDIGDRLESYVKSGTMEPDEVGEIVTKLQSLTAPFVDWYPGDILRDLPGLEEYTVCLNLTKAQLRTLKQLPSLGSEHRNSHMFKQKKLQSACVHPSLARSNDGDILEHPSESSDPHDGVKVTFILELIALCQRSKEKILIFCTTLAPFCYFEKVLGDIFGWEKEKQILRLDGKMQEWDRQAVINKFNESDSHRLLLASTKACKEGISLVGASRVVILDNPDNPSVVRQAVSRAFRIGQNKKVYVYRLVARHKDEEETFLRSVNKERLSQVLSDPRNVLATLEQFLREETEETVGDGILQKMMLGRHRHIFSSVRRYNASG